MFRILLSCLLLCAGSAWATDSSLAEHSYSYDFGEVNVNVDPTIGNVVNVNGVSVSISGWADSAQLVHGDSGQFDRVISANLQEVPGYGWAVRNSYEDENWHQTVDNTSSKGWQDYDFILFSFSSAVTLTNIDFGWAPTQEGSQEVSVAALGTSGLNALTGQQSTWSNIIADALSSSYSLTHIGNNQHTTDLNFTETARYWLVGAYNTVFGSVTGGSTFNDRYKISGINFTKPSVLDPDDNSTPVNAPGTLAIMCLSLFIFALKRKKVSRLTV